MLPHILMLLDFAASATVVTWVDPTCTITADVTMVANTITGGVTMTENTVTTNVGMGCGNQG